MTRNCVIMKECFDYDDLRQIRQILFRNICLRNFHEDPTLEYDSIQTFLEEWEELSDE